MLAFSSSQHVCYHPCYWKLPRAIENSNFFCKYYVWFHLIFHFRISLQKLQIYATPVFDMLETLSVKKLNFRPCFRLRLITHTLYVGEWLMLFFVWTSYDKASSAYLHVLTYLRWLQLLVWIHELKICGWEQRLQFIFIGGFKYNINKKQNIT